MSREPFARHTGRTVVLAADDVDTDQIIPARYLTGTSREGLGRGLFAGWRFDAEGRPRPEFPLNRPAAMGATVLVAGRNFGCGSSREHAVWALMEFGFRAVIARSFGDIFRANALKNGLLPVEVGAEVQARLAESPGAEVTLDLAGRMLTVADGRRVSFELDAFARRCLLEGIDEMEFLLAQEAAIAAYEARSER